MDGETKWNYVSLYRLAIEGIFSFTSVPMKIWSYFGIIIAFSGVIFGIYKIFKTLYWGIDVPGYVSLMVVMLFMSVITLVIIEEC